MPRRNHPKKRFAPKSTKFFLKSRQEDQFLEIFIWGDKLEVTLGKTDHEFDFGFELLDFDSLKKVF